MKKNFNFLDLIPWIIVGYFFFRLDFNNLIWIDYLIFAALVVCFILKVRLMYSNYVKMKLERELDEEE